MSALAVVVALNACGGATKTVTQPVAPAARATTATQTVAAGMSHADLIAALNEVCDSGNRQADKFSAAMQTAQDNDDYKGMADALEHTLPLYNTAAEKIAQLHPAGPDQDPFGRYVQAFSRQRGIVKRMIDSLRASDTDTTSELIGALNAAKRQRLTAALDLGADKCGK